MITCPACKELITPSCIVYRSSIGFIDTEDTFFVDKSILVHQECHYDYLYNPFEVLENDLKNF